MLLQVLLSRAFFCLTHGAKNYNLKENMRQQMVLAGKTSPRMPDQNKDFAASGVIWNQGAITVPINTTPTTHRARTMP